MVSQEKIDALRAAGERLAPMRLLKTEKEIAGCREAGRVNRAVLDAVAREIAVGMSTGEIDDIVMRETRALGGTPACLGYEGFPRAVCTSVNDVVCHGIPSHDQILHEGDIVNVDCTTIYGGYFGDASRMFTFGPISEEASRLVETTKEAVECAVSHLVPYQTHLSDIGYYINTLARSRGFRVVREIGGHGVGLAMHEDPYVCHTGFWGKGMVLLPGMIFTIEPMINAGMAQFYVDDKDGWTVRTVDGRLSAQVEYEVLLTEEGYEILSS